MKTLNRLFLLAIPFWLFLGSEALTQDLKDNGMLAIGTMSRTRAADADFQLGDLMYVRALQPANSGQMYVSVHMEYDAGDGNWQPVPCATTPLGQEYKSGKYPGLRDYVKFLGTPQTTTRHVSLFLPYHAAGLPPGKTIRRRYVLRLWNNDNKEVSNTTLDGEMIETKTENGRLVLRIVKLKTCAAAVFAETEGPLEPIVESVDNGDVRFFNTKTGTGVCLTDGQQ